MTDHFDSVKEIHSQFDNEFKQATIEAVKAMKGANSSNTDKERKALMDMAEKLSESDNVMSRSTALLMVDVVAPFLDTLDTLHQNNSGQSDVITLAVVESIAVMLATAVKGVAKKGSEAEALEGACRYVASVINKHAPTKEN